MAQNKEQLDKLLGFIKTIIDEPGNDEFTQKLRALVSPDGEPKAFHDSSVLNDHINSIYEFCIERIIRDHAVRFYNAFPIESLKSSLIDDFVRMEHFRRKDDFDDFCLAMYQQIECITNYICNEPSYVDVVSKMMDYSAYTPDGVFEVRYSPDSSTGKLYKVGDLLFGKEDTQNRLMLINDTKQYATNKINSVLYFVGYQAKMKNSEFNEFIFYRDMLGKIYQCRNRNHRGSVSTEFQQKTYNEIAPFKSEYYLKFLGVLAFFVGSIREGYPHLSHIKEVFDDNKFSFVAQKSTAVESKGPKVVGKIDLDNMKYRK